MSKRPCVVCGEKTKNNRRALCGHWVKACYEHRPVTDCPRCESACPTCGRVPCPTCGSPGEAHP